MIFYILCLVGLAIAQSNSSTTLGAVLLAKNLTTFKAYLDRYPAFESEIAAGNVTILAPSNEAFVTFNNTANANQTTPGAILAALQYHVLFGRWPVLSYLGQPLVGAGDTPEFLPTLLNNATYCNVTGGQRVEQVFNTKPVFRSAIKQDSNITITDIAFQDPNGGQPGLIQVIDRVLSIPISTVGTLKAAPGLTTAYNLASKLPQETSQNSVGNKWKYVTFFVPNSGIPDLSKAPTDYLVSLTDYHLYPDFLLYGPDLTDGLVIKSNQGTNATIRIVNGSTYINANRIVLTDYLIYNGVMHTIDGVLNYSTPNALPAPLVGLSDGTPTDTPSPASSPHSNPSGLPIGAKIGIGLVVGITVLGLIGIAIYYWRRRTGRSTKEEINELHGQYKLEKVHELASPREIPELDDEAQIVAELHDETTTVPSELPAESWNRTDESNETSSLKELDMNERLDVIRTDARSRRRSDEIRLMRKHELEMNRAENERENTVSPFHKLANEIKEDGAGVYRPSDHAAPDDSPEGFGLSRISENRPDEVPADGNSLDRMMMPPIRGQSPPPESNTGGTRSQTPINPISK